MIIVRVKYRTPEGQRDAFLQQLFDEGLPQDDEQAVVWYRKGAARGHALSEHCLGWMHEHGRGVPKDEEEAISVNLVGTMDFTKRFKDSPRLRSVLFIASASASTLLLLLQRWPSFR